MDNTEEQNNNRILIQSLENLFEEIRDSKDEVKAMSCDGWIKIYNSILRRLKSNNVSNSITMNFLKGYHHFELSFSKIDKPEKWSDGIGKSNRMKFKANEIVLFFKPNLKNKNEIKDVKSLIKNIGLLNACKTCLDNGDSWDACGHALRHLEVKIREKAGLSADYTGVDLINEAFKTDGGKLKIPSCATISEEKGFHLILLGVMQFHRNAKGHREGILDEDCAIKIVLYIDYLLEIIKTAVPRENTNIN